MKGIRYRFGNKLDLDDVIDLYRRSTLGERRPVDDRKAMKSMLDHANLVVTAWRGRRLVGIARTLTDFLYVGYMSDLAVDTEFQHRGIGRALIAETRKKMGNHSKIVLLAAPRARRYYPHIGFSRHRSAWTLSARDRLKGA